MPCHGGFHPDLKRFKALTMGHPIIMGRKTFESIGRPLPGRTSIVVTHQSGYEVQGAAVVHSVATALRECYKNTDTTETFIIGGAEIFRQTLPVCDRMYITEIQGDYEGDVLFPEFDQRNGSKPPGKNTAWTKTGWNTISSCLTAGTISASR